MLSSGGVRGFQNLHTDNEFSVVTLGANVNDKVSARILIGVARSINERKIDSKKRYLLEFWSFGIQVLPR